ncbi:MAG: S46 family peptidase, partial [Vulcanimicrobiota bacterium]
MTKRALLLLALLQPAGADEGMWLFNQAPVERLRKDYGFELTQPWLDHVMMSCVRFNNGGSGGFISQDGLVVTNHHIGEDSLQKLSKPGKDLVQLGFLARTLAEEPKCPDMELNVLQSIEDVTAQVEASVKPGMSMEQAANARRSFTAALEKSESEKTGLRCDVVTLYLGGAYHLYRYKKYTDVRLVMAPEQGAAFYGGDADNFEYPRYDFDVCFFRIYENGKPLHGNPYMKWNAAGTKSGELVFVAGHPGRTNRLETMARLQHLRDQTLPFRLAALKSEEMALRLYSQRGPEQRRQAQSELYGIANARKAYSGQFEGLLDHGLMNTKQQREDSHRQAASSVNPAFEAVSKAQQSLSAYEKEYYLLEQRLAVQGTAFEFARHLARWATEKSKTNGDRLREYRESNQDSLWQEVLSPADIFPDLEVAELTASLSFAAETLGGDHPTTQLLLAGKSPEARANELIRGTAVTRLGGRRRYKEMTLAELKAQQDPLIDLALAIDEASRKVRRRYELEVVE